jgi:hypothetical protein
VIASQIGPGPRYQGRQPGKEILGRKQNMGGAIAERVLEFVDHLAGSIGRQTLKADGGTCDVAAQTLKSLALVGLAGDGSI